MNENMGVKPPTPTSFKVLVGVAIFLGVVVLVGAGVLVGMYFFGPGHAQADKAAEQKASQSEPRKEKSGTEEKSKTGQTQKPADTKPKIDPDAIKKFNFANATWKMGFGQNPATIKFENGRATVSGANSGFETYGNYDPLDVVYGFLNDDEYLDAYTIASFTDSSDGGFTSAKAVAWIWDPKTKTAIPQPRTIIDSPGIGEEKGEVRKAVESVRKDIEVRNQHFFIKNATMGITGEQEVGLFKGFPICKKTLISCEGYYTVSVNPEIPGPAGKEIRSAPFPDAPVPTFVKNISVLRSILDTESINGYTKAYTELKNPTDGISGFIVWIK